MRRLREAKDEQGWVLVTMILLLSVLVILWSYVLDGAYARTQTAEVKRAANRALKAAVLQLDSEALGRGQIAIDDAKSRNAFQEVLTKNLKLNADYSTTEHSAIAGGIVIDTYQIYNGPTFPHTVTFTATADHPELSYTFKDPGIFLIMAADIPRSFAVGNQTIYISAAAEAKK